MSFDFFVTEFRRHSGSSLVLPIHDCNEVIPQIWLSAAGIGVGALGQASAIWQGGQSGDSDPGVQVLRLKHQVQHPRPAGHRMLRWTNVTSTSTARNVA